MKVIKTQQDIFTLPKVTEAVCVTTNGIVKKNGCAVMGKGIAKQADELYNVSKILGMRLEKYGNRAFVLGKICHKNESYHYLISFPTKHDWRDDSDIELIMKSCREITDICNKFNITKCYLPPVGCGCGNLLWDDVCNFISPLLDNRFIAVLRK